MPAGAAGADESAGVELPGTEEAAGRHLAIPMSAVLSCEQATEVVAAIKSAGLG